MFDRFKESLANSLESLDQTVTELKTSTIEVSDRVTEGFSHLSDQAAAAVGAATEQATDMVTGAANGAAGSLEQASRSLGETAAQTQRLIQEIVPKAKPISGFSSGVQSAIAGSAQIWIAQHPALGWVMGHPLWAAALVLIALLSLWGLLGAIAQFIRQIWVGILRLPLQLMCWLLVGVFGWFKRADALQRQAKQPDLQTRLLEILSRLESLRQEQEALMQEMQVILTAKVTESVKTN
ncbi:MAG: hypothetical protein HC886_22060 [Leptolyngbyaceae cyanobacterium SM1_1_3]|nr:hypothetical protein [Leptolyngbyaceae cyanobacterium SM1_1_3]